MIQSSAQFLRNIADFNGSGAKKSKKGGVEIIIISHILPDKLDFINVLSEYFRIAYVIPKPNSIDKNTYAKINENYNILNITREDIYNQKEYILEKCKNIKGDILIVDIGGYFAKVSDFLYQELGEKIIGIVEDTENGHQKYEKMKKSNLPIISVARSILKEPEDLLVGQSIVFSTDYVLRENNVLLNNKVVAIIGFGKIGKSIARELHGKHLQFFVYDIDPLKLLEAFSYGYKIIKERTDLQKADLIFCATGNFSFSGDEFYNLKKGVILSSVTSSDDELDINFLNDSYSKKYISEYIDEYYNTDKSIYLLNKGNAINFINNAVVGNFIYLVQGEIIHSLFSLLKKSYCSNKIDIIENGNIEKKYIVDLWLKHFTY